MQSIEVKTLCQTFWRFETKLAFENIVGKEENAFTSILCCQPFSTLWGQVYIAVCKCFKSGQIMILSFVKKFNIIGGQLAINF